MRSVDDSRINDFQAVQAAFRTYLAAADSLNDAMAALGVTTRNVDPLSNLAEVIVAREMNGVVQRATNKGFDVRTSDGAKVQVKSLRVTSAKSEDNWLTWRCCTREKGLADGPLIDADFLAVVTYLDSRPHSLLIFRTAECERFPVVTVKDLFFRHVKRLLIDRDSLDVNVVRVIDLHDWVTR